LQLITIGYHMFSPPFHENWIRFHVQNYLNIWEFSDEFGEWLDQYGNTWNVSSLKQMMLDSTDSLKDQLGDNPVIALSGGIDSQAVCLAMKEIGANFRVAIMKFNDDWNEQDVKNAEYFCKVNNLDYQFHELQIFDFLKYDLRNYVKKYSCPSPQLCCHHWLLEQVKQAGASGILLGGDIPSVAVLGDKTTWGFAMSRSQSSWINHQEINQIPIKAWKSWSKEIATAFLLTVDPDETKPFYQSKVNSSLALGLDIIPQTDKKNGFELVKKYFEKQTGNGWAFELLYRHPNYAVAPEYKSHMRVPKHITEMVLTIKNRILDEIKNQ
jgi:hypothetical protein